MSTREAPDTQKTWTHTCGWLDHSGIDVSLQTAGLLEDPHIDPFIESVRTAKNATLVVEDAALL